MRCEFTVNATGGIVSSFMRHDTGGVLLLGLQPLGEARARQADRLQLAEQSLVIRTYLLVDLDPVVLDGDPVPARLGMLLYRCLNGRHLLWLDQ
jgi:hypothetical protein